MYSSSEYPGRRIVGPVLKLKGALYDSLDFKCHWFRKKKLQLRTILTCFNGLRLIPSASRQVSNLEMKSMMQDIFAA